MLVAPAQYRELVFEFSGKTCTCGNSYWAYHKSLTGGTYHSMFCPALQKSVDVALDMVWADKDTGPPYYIGWRFYTPDLMELFGIKATSGAFVNDAISVQIEIDGAGTWGGTGYLAGGGLNPQHAHLAFANVLVSDTAAPTSCDYPDPWDLIVVGNTYSGRVRCTV